MKPTVLRFAIAALLASAVGFVTSSATGDRTTVLPPRTVANDGGGYYRGPPPFGQIAVADNGTVVFDDQQHARIGEVTSHGSKVILRSLDGSRLPPVLALSVMNRTIWLAADGGIYSMNLAGQDIRRVARAPSGVNVLDVLRDGTIYYATLSDVYERTPDGKTRQIAGCGTTAPCTHWGVEYRNVNELPGQPLGIAGTSSSEVYFTAPDSSLDLVDSGTFSMIHMQTYNGQMAAGPGGRTYALCGWSVCRIADRSYQQLFEFATNIKGTLASPNAFAVGPSGNFYISFPADRGDDDMIFGIYEMSPTGKFLGVVASQREANS